jgi:hypothetical protein
VLAAHQTTSTCYVVPLLHTFGCSAKVDFRSGMCEQTDTAVEHHMPLLQCFAQQMRQIIIVSPLPKKGQCCWQQRGMP